MPANSRSTPTSKRNPPDANLLDHRWAERCRENYFCDGVLAASRLFLAEIRSCIQQRNDFAFETTLAGRSYLKLVHRLRGEGWRIELIYLALPSINMSRMRVAERVAHGGHPIPEADIQRRFARSLTNLFNDFSAEVDACRCYMNSDASPELIFEQKGKLRTIVQPIYYHHLLQEVVP